MAEGSGHKKVGLIKGDLSIYIFVNFWYIEIENPSTSIFLIFLQDFTSFGHKTLI